MPADAGRRGKPEQYNKNVASKMSAERPTQSEGESEMAYQAKMFSVDRTVRRMDVETGHRPLARLQELTLCVSGILRQIHCPDRSRRSIEHARTLLHSVDVSLEVKGRATRHLQNADQYLSRGENGAARWEIVSLRHILARHT
jgi:hypothetical protein